VGVQVRAASQKRLGRVAGPGGGLHGRVAEEPLATGPTGGYSVEEVNQPDGTVFKVSPDLRSKRADGGREKKERGGGKGRKKERKEGPWD